MEKAKAMILSQIEMYLKMKMKNIEKALSLGRTNCYKSYVNVDNLSDNYEAWLISNSLQDWNKGYTLLEQMRSNWPKIAIAWLPAGVWEWNKIGQFLALVPNELNIQKRHLFEAVSEDGRIKEAPYEILEKIPPSIYCGAFSSVLPAYDDANSYVNGNYLIWDSEWSCNASEGEVVCLSLRFDHRMKLQSSVVTLSPEDVLGKWQLKKTEKMRPYYLSCGKERMYASSLPTEGYAKYFCIKSEEGGEKKNLIPFIGTAGLNEFHKSKSWQEYLFIESMLKNFGDYLSLEQDTANEIWLMPTMTSEKIKKEEAVILGSHRRGISIDMGELDLPPEIISSFKQAIGTNLQEKGKGLRVIALRPSLFQERLQERKSKKEIKSDELAIRSRALLAYEAILESRIEFSRKRREYIIKGIPVQGLDIYQLAHAASKKSKPKAKETPMQALASMLERQLDIKSLALNEIFVETLYPCRCGKATIHMPWGREWATGSLEWADGKVKINDSIIGPRPKDEDWAAELIVGEDSFQFYDEDEYAEPNILETDAFISSWEKTQSVSVEPLIAFGSNWKNFPSMAYEADKLKKEKLISQKHASETLDNMIKAVSCDLNSTLEKEEIKTILDPIRNAAKELRTKLGITKYPAIKNTGARGGDNNLENTLGSLIGIRCWKSEPQIWKYSVGPTQSQIQSGAEFKKTRVVSVKTPNDGISLERFKECVLDRLSSGMLRIGAYSKFPALFKILMEGMLMQLCISGEEEKLINHQLQEFLRDVKINPKKAEAQAVTYLARMEEVGQDFQDIDFLADDSN